MQRNSDNAFGLRHRAYKVFPLLLFCGLFLSLASAAQSYVVRLHSVDKDSAALLQLIKPPAARYEGDGAYSYIRSVVPALQEKGYLAASIDSIAISADAYYAYVYLGEAYRWGKVSFDSIPQGLLVQAAISRTQWEGRPLNAQQIAAVTEKLLQFAEDHGYPFARVWLEITEMNTTERVSGQFLMDRGPLQRIDTVVIHGDVRISRNYLLRYLDLKQGEPYNERKLRTISNRINEIPFLQEAQPWSVEFSVSDTKLNIYLKEKKANQLNGIVGLLPNSAETGKLLLTVDALFAFRNILAQGESINVSYQNLQYKSPRFKADVTYPYLLNTPLGIDARFDLFKKDTTFRRTSFQGGVRYQVSSADYIRVFYQHQSNRLISVDTAAVRATKRLPDDVDVTANGGGVEAGINRTDYRISPRRGLEARLTTSALVRKVRKSDVVTGMSDAAGFDFEALYDTLVQRQNQYFINGNLTYYKSLGRKIVLRSAYDGGWVSGEHLFRNELYQIGGFRLLRGFDEQSVFTNQYHVLSLELRLLLDRNSYIYLFSDNGYVESNFSVFRKSDIYNGFGLGTTLETKSGLFTISYALGQNSENPVQFRQSKLHFGYIAFF